MNGARQIKGGILIKMAVILLIIGIGVGVAFLATKNAKQKNGSSGSNTISEITTTSQTVIPKIDVQNKILEDWSGENKVVISEVFSPEILPTNYSGKFVHDITISPDYKKILCIADDVKSGHGNIGKLIFKNLERNINEEISLPLLSKLDYKAGIDRMLQPNRSLEDFHCLEEFNSNSGLVLFKIWRGGKSSLTIIDSNTGEYNTVNNVIAFWETNFFPDGTLYYFQKDGNGIKGYFGGKIKVLPLNTAENLSCHIENNFLLCTTVKENEGSYMASAFVLNKKGEILYKTSIKEPIKYDPLGYKIGYWLDPLAYDERTNQLVYASHQSNDGALLYRNDTLIALPIDYSFIINVSAVFDNEGRLWVRAVKRIPSSANSVTESYLVMKDGEVINVLKAMSEFIISNDKSKIAYRGSEIIDGQEYESVFVNGQKVFSRLGKCLNSRVFCSVCCDKGLSFSPDGKSVAIILGSKIKKDLLSLRINQVDVGGLELEGIIGDLMWVNNKMVAVIEGLNKYTIPGEDMAQTIVYRKKRIHLINTEGQLIWSSPLFDDIFSRPILIGNKIIFIAQEGKQIVQKVYEVSN